MSKPRSGSVLAWGQDGVPPAARAALTGAGMPFETAVEDVLGAPAEVFVRRHNDLPAMLAHAAHRRPDQPFLVFPERTTSYRGALRLITARASLLADVYGVRKGDRVALAGTNSLEHVLAYWAVLELGAIAVGLNGWWAGPELAYGTRLTEPRVVLADGKRTAVLREHGVPAVDFRAFAGAADARRATAEPELPRVPVSEDDPAIILFTSGTTGRPKGAVISHRNIVYFAQAWALHGAIAAAQVHAHAGSAGTGAPPNAAGPTAAGSPAAGSTAARQSVSRPPVALVTSPFFHVSGAANILATGPFNAGTAIFPPPGRWDEGVQLELMARHRITRWSGVPAQYWRLLGHPRFGAFDLSAVTALGCGGANLAPELLRRIRGGFPNAQVSNGYGMTETFGAGTVLAGVDAATSSVGTPIPHTRVRIRSADGGEVAAGEVGEIHLQGPGVFLGYWADPAATRAALDSERWYRTGDFGRIENGVLHLESRMRDLIIRGGENIYPVEVENRLVEHPHIADAAVVAVDHTVLGHEVKAVVVPVRGAELTADAVRGWVADALAAFKVPAYVEFRTELPYSDTGKVLKRLLEAGR
ncbi:class I adenylate-forming enzyme family protein [Streptodolium elevatio]|uniref:Class I adenylate-forming enzyme family protein n=1 Tax=Streptodolium elevatio TaxID=3157996 RepID=A0ABV3DSP4_9ACTN